MILWPPLGTWVLHAEAVARSLFWENWVGALQQLEGQYAQKSNGGPVLKCSGNSCVCQRLYFKRNRNWSKWICMILCLETPKWESLVWRATKTTNGGGPLNVDRHKQVCCLAGASYYFFHLSLSHVYHVVPPRSDPIFSLQQSCDNIANKCPKLDSP